MTKLQFRSAFHYDRTLAVLAGKELLASAEQELDDYVQKAQSSWDQYNDSLFLYYESIGLTLPETWYAYPIHSNGETTSFAEPTTIIMRDNTDEFFATLVHELCHIFCGLDQNDETLSLVWGKVSDTFKELEIGTREHILVNTLARSGLRHILGFEKAEILLGLEKNYPSLQEAWKIIDAHPNISPDNPFEFLEALVQK